MTLVATLGIARSNLQRSPGAAVHIGFLFPAVARSCLTQQNDLGWGVLMRFHQIEESTVFDIKQERD
jgi:hypothetical protein